MWAGLASSGKGQGLRAMGRDRGRWAVMVAAFKQDQEVLDRKKVVDRD